jgi:hypothetical protein
VSARIGRNADGYLYRLAPGTMLDAAWDVVGAIIAGDVEAARIATIDAVRLATIENAANGWRGCGGELMNAQQIEQIEHDAIDGRDEYRAEAMAGHAKEAAIAASEQNECNCGDSTPGTKTFSVRRRGTIYLTPIDGIPPVFMVHAPHS